MLFEFLASSGDGSPVTSCMDVALYTGNGTSQTITGGVDLSGGSGLIIVKVRNTGDNWVWTDTIRGVNSQLVSNSVGLPTTETDCVTAFTTDGFSVGADLKVNRNSTAIFSAAFRESLNYFEVDKITADDTEWTWTSSKLKEIGFAIIKTATGSAENFFVAHKGLASGYYAKLDSSNAPVDDSSTYAISGKTLTFTTTSTREYMIYAFAEHARRVVSGSYIGSSSGVTIATGWEPRLLLTKRTSSGGGEQDWQLTFKDGSNYCSLEPNTDRGTNTPSVTFTSTGATLSEGELVCQNGETYIYTAFR